MVRVRPGELKKRICGVCRKSFFLFFGFREQYLLFILVGKLQEYPEIMAQGETLEKLEENIRDGNRCRSGWP
jgi:hypothetical protein